MFDFLPSRGDLPPTDELLVGGPVPFFVALFLVALLARRRSLDAPASALAVGAGYLVLHVYLIGWLLPGNVPSFAAIRAEQWLAWLVLLGIGVGSLFGARGGAFARWTPMTLGAAVLFLIQFPILKSSDAFTERASLLLVTGGLWYGALAGWSAAGRSGNGRRPLLTLVIVTTVASLVIGFSGSRKLAQMAGAGSAALVGLLLFTAAAERSGEARRDLYRGALPPAFTWSTALLLCAYHFAYLDLDVALLVLAPAIVLPVIGRFVSARTWIADGVVASVGALPALVALWIAAQRFAAEAADNPYG